MLTSHRVTLLNCMCNCNKNIKYQFELVCCMKAKTVIYGAYFALKLWAYRAYTKYIKKQKGEDKKIELSR